MHVSQIVVKFLMAGFWRVLGFLGLCLLLHWTLSQKTHEQSPTKLTKRHFFYEKATLQMCNFYLCVGESLSAFCLLCTSSS